MRIAFRVDASRSIGTGHVVRCVSLAKALASRGAECVFVHRDQPGCMTHWIRRKGFAVLPLSSRENSRRYPLETVLPEHEQYADLEETLKVLGGSFVDWMVVDHYALDARWEEPIRRKKISCLAVDDLANRRHAADILLDQNFFLEPGHRYDGLVRPDTTCLLGPQYALIDREYRRLRELMDAPRKHLHRLLVFHGGTDPDGASTIALEALDDPRFRSIDVDMVIGPNNPHRQALLKVASKRSNINTYDLQESLAAFMLRADLMLGAGGTTTWERCVLRLPALVTTIAPNQRHFTRDLHETGALIDLGSVELVTPSAVSEALEHILENSERLREMSEKAGRICDGWGCQRVAEFLIPSRRFHCISNANSDELVPISITNQEGLTIGCTELYPTEDPTVLSAEIQPDWSIPREPSRQKMIRCLLVELYHRTVFTHFLCLPEQKPTKPVGYRITVLSDPDSWMNAYVPDFLERWLMNGHAVRWVSDPSELQKGDFCFILGCTRLVTSELRTLNRHNLVVHESDLPLGRGFSPLTWQIIEGKNDIPIQLLEADDEPDAGTIYIKATMRFEGNELVEELREIQAAFSWRLCSTFVEEYPRVLSRACKQVGDPTWYARLTSADSRIDIDQPIRHLFDRFRTIDNDRYPAWFEFRGRRYYLGINSDRQNGLSKAETNNDSSVRYVFSKLE